MSLNHAEEALLTYVQDHADERHHWEDKVRALMEKSPDNHASSASLAFDLWRYYDERSRSVPALREGGPPEQNVRISMRNLAEHMMRNWGPIQVRRRFRSRSTGGEHP